MLVWDTHVQVLVWDTHFTVWFGSCWYGTPAGMGHPLSELLVWDTHFWSAWYGTPGGMGHPLYGLAGMGHPLYGLVWDTHFRMLVCSWYGTPTLGCWYGRWYGTPTFALLVVRLDFCTKLQLYAGMGHPLSESLVWASLVQLVWDTHFWL